MLRQSNRGFTLLEVLVVILLTGMITTLLMQAVSYVLLQKNRFTTQLENQQAGKLPEIWFRMLVNGTYPLLHATDFMGDGQKFHGVTLNALEQEPGIPAHYALELKNEQGTLSLLYSSVATQQWFLRRWRGASGEFQYMSEGQWHDAWPINGKADEQLPDLIKLTVTQASGAVVWIADIQSRKTPKIDIRDILL